MASELGPLALAALVAAASASWLAAPLAFPAAAALLALCWRGSTRTLRVLSSALLASALLLRWQTAVVEGVALHESETRMAAELQAVQARARALGERLAAAAAGAAALREAKDALTGKGEARGALFRALEALRGPAGGDVALAVHAPDWTPLAWSGRIVELVPFQALIPPRADVFALEGSLQTALIAAAPLAGPGRRPLGYATAEITVATRRNVSNEYLRDFDLLAADASNVELRYVDLRDASPAEHAFPPLPEGFAFRTDVVKSRGGSPIAAIRVTPPRPERQTAAARARERRLLSALAIALLAAWLVARPLRPARLAWFAVSSRLVLLGLGLPYPAASSPLLSPDVYSAAPAARPELSWLPLLAKSPLDLLLTACALLLLLALLLRSALQRAQPSAPAWRALLVDVLALPLLGLAFLVLFDTLSQCTLDLEDVAIVPKSAALFVMQAALLAILAAGAASLASLLTLAGPLPGSARGFLLRGLGWGLILAAAFRFWPRERLGLPLLPALLLFFGAAAVAGSARRLWPRLARASADERAALALAAVGALGMLLFPSLVHFGEKRLRRAIENSHAPLVLRQPEWRDYVLRESRRKIDDLGLLESEPQGPHPPEIEELAYAVWSATDLAAFGFTSAVEIQDPQGRIVSRFALNLPSIAGVRRPLPPSTDWDITRELSTVASAERPVLHARRLIASEGRVRGAVHVFVGDDFWNLPFLRSRDPYSVLYRRTAVAARGTRPLGLLVYDATLRNVFSSDERPPSLEPALLRRLQAAPGGLWTTLAVDGRPHHAFLVADGSACYGITYPRTGAVRYLADLVEAVLSLTLAGLAALAVVILLRTLSGKTTLCAASAVASVRRRFTLRLFVAFLVVAIAPVLVLQNVVERFVSDRLRGEAAGQALDLAAVAKKAVEDFVFFQRSEAPGDQPVTDAVLVWVASLIQNDLDVFERGRLLASSKRELYASGLLPQRLSGEVFRAIALDGEQSSLRSEHIGSFSYQAVSVPLFFESGGPRVLSIPLALRQREAEAVVEDLRRTIRLASLLFLGAAAGLAVSMSRRISGPVRALTEATRRVAAGDFQASVSATTRDELQELVESFNRMAQDLEQQRRDLERTNRLAAWAEMARQVAHEVKNPLTPIQLAAEHLRRVYADGGADFARTLASCTETILKQVQTLRGIVTEFSSFARPPGPVLERLELTALLQEVARSYRDVLPSEVRLELLPGASPVVAADRRLLERALVNLVENALQAVGEKGAVRLRLREDGAGRAVIEVEDTGPGLDAEAKARIFEPFFSTKANGSGLGLALVKKIAEDHGGGVSIDSTPGGTTCARLWFPAAPPA